MAFPGHISEVLWMKGESSSSVQIGETNVFGIGDGFKLEGLEGLNSLKLACQRTYNNIQIAAMCSGIFQFLGLWGIRRVPTSYSCLLCFTFFLPKKPPLESA